MITPSYGLTATERVLPKLALDFTTGALDSRVTFTRAGTGATRFNSSGLLVDVPADTPRFDYNPTTLACNGLLIEESRKNSVRYSEDINNAAWIKTGISGSFTVTTDQYVSPRGAQTVAKLTLGSTGVNTIRQNSTDVPSAGTYTCSAWIRVISGNVTNITFDVGNGTEGSVFSQLVSGQLVRCSASVTKGGTNTWFDIQVTGDSGAEIAIWGIQVEFGAFATSYIPTTSTALTRNADVATMTGTNFSDWYNQSEGTVFAQTSSNIGYPNLGFSLYQDANNTILDANDGTVGKCRLLVRNGGSFVTNVSSSVTTYAPMKQAFGLKSGAISAAVNGTLFINNNAGTIPTSMTELWIGRRGDNGGYANGWVQKINYYPMLLTQNELRAISK